MNRDQLEHIVRASAAITGRREFVLIGSQAVLGQFPEAPPEMRRSMELDIFTVEDPADAELVDGSIGEGSPFHQTFGYYAHGVGVETATLPREWRSRVIVVETPRTGGAAAVCPEIHDLLISKLVAGRDKDLDFIALALSHGLATAETLATRLAETSLDAAGRRACDARLDRLRRGGR